MTRVLVLLAVVGFVAPAAAGQLLWSENFDSLAATPVPGFGTAALGVPSAPANRGWDSWYLNPAGNGGISTAQAFSGANSMEVSGPGVAASGSDMVQEFAVQNVLGAGAGYTSSTFPQNGVWTLRAMTYVDSTLPTGSQSCYFIVNDLLNNATSGPSQWIMQVQFNHATGRVADDQRVPASGGAAINYNNWTEISARFDLDNGSASVTYNGCNIGNGPLFVTGWNVGTGPMQIANLDCFTIDSQLYYDDISLTKEVTPGPWFQVNNYNAVTMTGLNADLNLIQGSGIAAAETSVAANTTVAANIECAITPGHEALINFAGAVPLGGGATVVAPGVLLNESLAPGYLFLYGGALPVLLPYAGGASTVFSFAAPAGPFKASIQWAILDPFAPSGLSLSQPCDVKVP